MQYLELLAPARNKEIGIAAINCGADAIYIAGPDFGARKAAGNKIEDIAELCAYAHLFGARVFVTFNTIFSDSQEEDVHNQMLQAQEAGADAFIIRDERITRWEDIHIPLHASTQCAIRDIARAQYLERCGCARIILERQLSLDEVTQICSTLNCEVEFFVHGALCVGYSGQCRLSEFIDGRSADKGECIQACRSLYDLVDSKGRVLVRNKALLSLKDYNLKNRLEDLAKAGVSSFKIEGRLKNASYVKNVVRDYDLALNALIAKYPHKYARASFGSIKDGFKPNVDKTFNRGYTDLLFSGPRGKWSSMDTPKSMGEAIGTITKLQHKNKQESVFVVKANKSDLVLHNGDGFSLNGSKAIIGFRADVCKGLEIHCKYNPELYNGAYIYRNIDSSFEKELEKKSPERLIGVKVYLNLSEEDKIFARAISEDGREVSASLVNHTKAENKERMITLLYEQISKKSSIYSFCLESVDELRKAESIPLLSAAAINGLRRSLSEALSQQSCKSRPLSKASSKNKDFLLPNNEMTIMPDQLLLQSRYCIRYELGLCPKHQGAKDSGPLCLVNNGRSFALSFNCSTCEMSIIPSGK